MSVNVIFCKLSKVLTKAFIHEFSRSKVVKVLVVIDASNSHLSKSHKDN